MKKYLIITADTNDGDYVTSKNVVTDEVIEIIKPVIEAIKNFKPYKTDTEGMSWNHRHNFPTQELVREDLGEKSARDYYVGGGFVTEDQFDEFDELVPFDEYGIHTIVSVEFLVVASEVKLF